MSERLQEIKQRNARRTQGKNYRVEVWKGDPQVVATVLDDDGKWRNAVVADMGGYPFMLEDNAKFFANAPADITWLVGEVERLRALASDAIKYLDKAGMGELAKEMGKEIEGRENGSE